MPNGSRPKPCKQLLPPTAGDGHKRLVKHGRRGTPAANGWRWPPTAADGRQQLAEQRLVEHFCGLNHEIRQRLDLQMSCCPSRRPTGARELCDEPHTAVRQWNGMLQEPGKQQLKTGAGIRPPGCLLAIVEIEEAGYAQWLMHLIAISISLQQLPPLPTPTAFNPSRQARVLDKQVNARLAQRLPDSVWDVHCMLPPPAPVTSSPCHDSKRQRPAWANLGPTPAARRLTTTTTTTTTATSFLKPAPIDAHLSQWRVKARSMPAQSSLLPKDTCQRLRRCASGYASVRLRLCANGYASVRIPCRSK